MRCIPCGRALQESGGNSSALISVRARRRSSRLWPRPVSAARESDASATFGARNQSGLASGKRFEPNRIAPHRSCRPAMTLRRRCRSPSVRRAERAVTEWRASIAEDVRRAFVERMQLIGDPLASELSDAEVRLAIRIALHKNDVGPMRPVGANARAGGSNKEAA